MNALDAPVLDAILATERAEMDDVRDEICALSGINSGTTNVVGTTSVLQLLASRLHGVGTDAHLAPSEPGWEVGDDGERRDVTVGPILRARFRPDAATRVVIAGHADTVFGPDHPFQSVVRDGELLRGPGVADMKGGLVAVVRAIRALERHAIAPDLGIDLIVNSDEEIGSPGSASAIDEAASNASSGIALVVEPRLPDGRFAGARPASANLALVVDGRGAHAGRALSDGRNAVVGASRLAVIASDLTGTRPHLGVNVAAITGGGPLNAVPDRCVVRVNLRSPSTSDLEWAIDELDHAGSAIAIDHELEVERHGGVHRPGKPWSTASRELATIVSNTAAALDLPSEFVDTGGVCDGNNLTAQGLAVVDTLGVSGAGIHTSDEYADLSSWPQNVALLVSTIAAAADLSPATNQPIANQGTTE